MPASPINRNVFVAQSLVILSTILLVTGLLVWSPKPVVRAEAVQDGPALGDVIDFLSLRDRKGRTLKEANKGRALALIMVVNPSCGSCASAKESIRELRERSEKVGMAYYVLMIPDGTDTEKYFSFADSLKLDVEAFVWANAEMKAPASLATMPVPSHLLVSSDGIVVNKWAGVPTNVGAP
jgi:hypothetical protein